jgi:EmrB/QacA subfamily drug resistance transporter
LSREKRKAEAAASAVSGVMTHRQIMMVLFGLMAGMFLSALDQSVVGTAITTIANDLKGLDVQAWVTTAYLITSTIATPIYGKLGDLFGRRRLFIIAISVFIVGSVAAGFSQSMYELAGWRALQGVGAGGLFSLAMTILADIVPPRERAKYMGMFLAVFATSSVLGPLIGGLFAGMPELLFIAGWRYVFLINLPIGIAALIFVVSYLHVPHHKKSGRIDWWGALTITVAVVPILIAAQEGQKWGWWSGIATDQNGAFSNPGTILLYAIAVVGIVTFILAERRMGEDALLPFSLFKSSTFTMSTILGVVVGAGMFGGMMTLPLILQIVYGANPTESGFLMLPMVLGMMSASILSGRITSKTGHYKRFMISGTAFMTAAFFYLSMLNADWQIWQMSIGMIVLGAGLGQLMQTLTTAAQNSVEPRNIGVATSAATFFRQMGGTLGVAVFISLLFNSLKDKAPGIFKVVFGEIAKNPALLAKPENAAFKQTPEQLMGQISTDASFLADADKVLAHPIQQGYAEAATTVFGVSTLVMIVAFVISFFVKEIALRQVSGVQANAEAAAKAAEAEAEAKIAALG